MEQALLINMYFRGQISFDLHPACDAKYHFERYSQTTPFLVKNIDENTAFLSTQQYFSVEPVKMYVTKKITVDGC